MSTDDKDETISAKDVAAANVVGEDAEAALDDEPEGEAPKSETADARPKKAEGSAATDAEASRRKAQVLSGLSWPWVAAVAVLVALCAVIVFGCFKYRAAEQELARIHQSEADRNTAAKMAKDYALKSLTYTYQDPDGFFASVEDGVAPPLKEKYTNAADLLKGIMTQAKVESSGEILATDVTAQPNNVYQVVVSASQTTKNLQSPQPRVSPIILQVVVNKVGGTWQISDIGPKSGAKPQPPKDQAPPAGPNGAVPPISAANPAEAAPPIPPARPLGTAPSGSTSH